jgi:transposase InsO family protein
MGSSAFWSRLVGSGTAKRIYRLYTEERLIVRMKPRHRTAQRQRVPQFSLQDARRKLESWRQDYNHYRPHSAQQDRTPAEVAAAWTPRAPGVPEAVPGVKYSTPLVGALT